MKHTLSMLLLLVCVISACKKSPAPTIVGNWRLTDLSGTYTTQSSPSATPITITYSYANSVIVESDTSSRVLVTVSEELWEFNSDGTFFIGENYQANTASAPTVRTLTGWWDYTGSTLPNSSVVLRSLSTPNITPTGGVFFIKSVTGTRLVLTVNESATSSLYVSTKTNFTLTFTRQ